MSILRVNKMETNIKNSEERKAEIEKIMRSSENTVKKADKVIKEIEDYRLWKMRQVNELI